MMPVCVRLCAPLSTGADVNSGSEKQETYSGVGFSAVHLMGSAPRAACGEADGGRGSCRRECGRAAYSGYLTLQGDSCIAMAHWGRRRGVLPPTGLGGPPTDASGARRMDARESKAVGTADPVALRCSAQRG